MDRGPGGPEGSAAAAGRAGPVLALVPAHDEEAAIAQTVKSLLTLEDVREVWVLADGCSDRTPQEAMAAGARVLVSNRQLGKGRAVDSALDLVPRLAPDAWYFLLVDGDVGESAAEAGGLLRPVLSGDLDAAVGRFPPLPGGGFGLVRAVARAAIRSLTGFDPDAPLSGQRALTRQALEACRPLSPGFGLETGMTIDLLRLGFRVGEVPVGMSHRLTWRDLPGFIHRARQGVDLLQAVAPRALGIR